MLHIKQFVFNPFDENTYLVSSDTEGGHDAIVIDPGMYNDAEARRFDDYVRENNLSIKAIVLTHIHLDHCFGAMRLHRLPGAPVMASTADAFLSTSLADQARRFGLRMGRDEAVSIDTPLHDGDTVAVGADSLTVLAVPGHSPGGIALYSAEGGVLFSGDSLFRRSIGRTALPGGSSPTLVDSVRNRLLSLAPDTLVLPGHGPSTTVREESLGNPFVR